MNRGSIYRIGVKIKDFGERRKSGRLVRLGLKIRKFAEKNPRKIIG